MSKAAGIILIIYGVLSVVLSLLFIVLFFITHVNIIDLDPSYILFNPFHLLFTIPAVFIVIGGVFCLKRKYWKLCFVSALLAVFMMIYWSWFPLYPSTSDWWAWFFIIAGTLPIIFVCIRKREWSEISA